MSDAILRAAIKDRLTSLGPIIGRVYDYERWIKEKSKLLALFQDPDSKKVFGWEITRTGFSFSKIGMRRYKFTHRYLIRGYYALEDAAATEKTVNALADQIALSFALDKIDGTQGEQMPEAKIATGFFGNLMCHVVEITLPQVTEIVAAAEEDAPALAGIDGEYYFTQALDDEATQPIADESGAGAQTETTEATDTINFS